MTWFSAMLRFVITIGTGAEGASRSVVLVRAEDHEAAFAASLARGRVMEQDYLNAAGERVQWRLEAIETIDELEDTMVDGREVYSERMPRIGSAGPSARPRPEESRPASSGV